MSLVCRPLHPKTLSRGNSSSFLCQRQREYNMRQTAIKCTRLTSREYNMRQKGIICIRLTSRNKADNTFCLACLLPFFCFCFSFGIDAVECMACIVCLFVFPVSFSKWQTKLNPFPAFRTSCEVCGKVHSVQFVCCNRMFSANLLHNFQLLVHSEAKLSLKDEHFWSLSHLFETAFR